jgi:hypothetical protein
MRKRLLRIALFSSIGLAMLCIAVAGVFALSNLELPAHSQQTDRLSPLEKTRLAEAIRLREALGDTVWPGWGDADIPVILYNEEYAFLMGYPDPPAGWVKVPQGLLQGGSWEIVPDDTFEGRPYYRQRLPTPEINPQNFTVRIGERWVATMQTNEYMEIHFYVEYREGLPTLLRSVFPYRLLWSLLMGETENYIGSLEHESFHALQGSEAPSRLAAAEGANRYEGLYPWDDPAMSRDWEQEMDLLVRAVRSSSDGEAADLVRQFLAQRDERRAIAGLSRELVDYERQRDWLEGLAKYVELSLGRLAASTPGYEPLPSLADDPNFIQYANRERFWSEQIDEAKLSAMREDETRFYYGGMAQAELLDRLLPGWKERAFSPDVMLEDLLREAINQP